MHQKLLALAWPLILANLSAPILGLVDTAVLGNLAKPDYLAGAAVASFLLAQLFWLLGFLRMSMSGLSAQHYGRMQTGTDTQGLYDDLMRGAILAVLLGALLMLGAPFIIHLFFQWTQLTELAAESAETYLAIRLYNAPISILGFVSLAWLIGQQQTRNVMWIQVLGNGCNIALNLILVYGFELGVAGVAWATLTAEWLMLIAALWQVWRQQQRINHTARLTNWRQWPAFQRLLSLNRDLFLRNIFLQGCLGYITYRGAQYGVTEAAINAVLMQLFVLVALGLDGIANAVEVMIGEYRGRQEAHKLNATIRVSLIWTGICSVLILLALALSYSAIFSLLAPHTEILVRAPQYLFVTLALCAVVGWCYCLDGIFIGLTRGHDMRDSMLFSALGFALTVALLSHWENQSLWWGLLVLQSLRGLTLGGKLRWLHRNQRLCA